MGRYDTRPIVMRSQTYGCFHGSTVDGVCWQRGRHTGHPRALSVAANASRQTFARSSTHGIGMCRAGISAHPCDRQRSHPGTVPLLHIAIPFALSGSLPAYDHDGRGGYDRRATRVRISAATVRMS